MGVDVGHDVNADGGVDVDVGFQLLAHSGVDYGIGIPRKLRAVHIARISSCHTTFWDIRTLVFVFRLTSRALTCSEIHPVTL